MLMQGGLFDYMQATWYTRYCRRHNEAGVGRKMLLINRTETP
jgi:hypothetical protein